MPTCIALFRGINVGGRNVLPMKALVRELRSLDLSDVRTYIQTGNAVFRYPGRAVRALGPRIAAAIEKRHGFRPDVLVLTVRQLEQASENNPFPRAATDPKTLHLFFLAYRPPEPDTRSLAGLRSPSEQFKLLDRVFYLHAPGGIGRSSLAAGLERHLGVAATVQSGPLSKAGVRFPSMRPRRNAADNEVVGGVLYFVQTFQLPPRRPRPGVQGARSRAMA